MSYTSLNFLLFVAATALIYFLMPKKLPRWPVLLIASYAFLLFVGYRHALYLLLTTVTVWGAALWMGRMAQNAKKVLKDHKEDWDRDAKKAFKAQLQRKKRAVMLLCVVLNLAVWFFVKYYNFLAGSLNELLGGAAFSLPIIKLLIPLGISFYTLQAVGYVLDVYAEKVEPEKNPFKIALFLSFFPQIVQGPISFYSQLAHQLYEPHAFSFTRAKYAGELVLWGLFKKMVIADRAVIALTAAMERYTEIGGITLLFTVLLYAVQLYADFSGGIDISRGVAQLFGIELAQNFRRPYFARSINEYWRRWHITLGAWMKEHVFYPIALSRRFGKMSKSIKGSRFGSTAFGAHTAKVLPTSIASLIVFLLVGVWHGDNWKYVGFGLWNGGIIMLSTLLEPLFEQMMKKLRIKAENWIFILFQMLRTFVIVLIGYVFDIAPNLTEALRSFPRFFDGQAAAKAGEEIMSLGLIAADYWLLGVCIVLWLMVSIVQEKLNGQSLRVKLDEKPFILRYFMLLVGILAILVFGIYGPGYDPAAFVYMQF